MKPAIAYLRVSTGKQGHSGLGLDAQRAVITAYALTAGYEVVQWLEEVETGKGSNALAKRPILRQAFCEAKRGKMPVIFANLGRLARNVAFISALMETKVPFVIATMPDATPVMLHFYAAMAEQEARDISQRTTAALAALKARGVVLGNRTNLPEAAKMGLAVRQTQANDFARNVLPIIHQIRAAGVEGYQAIAETLNARGIKTVRGGEWFAQSVKNVLLRDVAANIGNKT